MYMDWAGILKEDEEGYHFQYRDFEVAMRRFEIDQKAFDNIFERFRNTIPKWHGFVEISFLPGKIKEAYHVMIDKKAKQIEL
jgi:serine/threonine-protein kinase HipA